MSLLFERPDELDTLDKDISFQIIDWFVPESDKIDYDFSNQEEAREYSVNIYGKMNNGISVCAKVINFEPYFYIKPPEEWELLDDKKFKQEVRLLELKLKTESYEYKFRNKINKKKIISKFYDGHLTGVNIEFKKDFWGFTNNKEFRFIKISVKSLGLFNSLKYYFQDNKDGFKLYESNIEPFLKLIHILKIKPCGWIKINKYSLDDIPETRCDYNITVNWKDIIPIDNNNIAPFVIVSFDIECMSSHGDFPVAIKNYKKLAQDLCQISKNNLDDEKLIENIIQAFEKDVIINKDFIINRLYSKTKISKDEKKKLREREDDIRFILNKIKSVDYVIDNDDDDDEGGEEDGEVGDGDDGEGVVSKKKFKSNITVKEANEIEDALNKKLCEILPELEGDKIIQIGTTVHIYGNDNIVYKNIITLDTCDKIDDVSVITCETEEELIKKWKQEIMKINPDIITGYNIWGFDMEYIWNRATELRINKELGLGLGRIINREVKLTEQKLSSSALGDNILKTFDLDGVVVIDLLKVMQRDHKLDSYKLDNVASVFIGSKKDDLKPNEIFEKFKGNSNDRCIIAKYCIQDCVLVNKLLHKLKIVENNSGMGNVCLVPLNYLFKRGQGIKIYSLICNECMKRDFVIPVKKYVINDFDMDGYEGAIVLEPKEGIYLDEPIVVFDYGSLYPSSMISKNLSHDTYIIDKKYLEIDDPNIEFNKVEYDIYEGLGDKKKKVGVKECIFAKYKDGRRGIIPDILTLLLEERKNTRNKIEHSTVTKKDGNKIIGIIINKDDIDKNDNNEIVVITPDKNKIKINKKDIDKIEDTYNKFEKDVFDALQSAYKVTANSLYGQIGAKTSAIYLKDIAACTTATGREMIMIAKNYVETNHKADVIYGDTDSIFCKFPLGVSGKEALEEAIKIGKIVEKNIASIMPHPQKLNYEKCLYPFILFSKKRYVGNLYENDVNKFKQKSMGIVLKRRDNANIVKKVYGGIIDIILNKQDLELAQKFLREELIDLVNGKADLKDLILSKTLKASYKDPTKIAHKVLADRIGTRDLGNKPAINDRIAYIYIKNPTAKLQGERIETPEFINENKLEPDYLFYITNQIMKPVLQLFGLCLTELIDYKEEHDYWNKIDDDLKLKPMYQDENKRKRRLDNLKLLKVKELLFDEFIYKLSEPKVKKEPKEKRVIIKKEGVAKERKKRGVKDDGKAGVEGIEGGGGKIEVIKKDEDGNSNYNGVIRIVQSKIKNSITYNIKITDEKNKVVYSKEDKEGVKSITKDKLLNELLLTIYKEFKKSNIIMKINYKEYVKKFNYLICKYDEYKKKMETYDKKTNDLEIIKIHKELNDNLEIMQIKDNIKIVE
jgi:DNA polymerase elongation subunit (family B)